jgi:hypothetical protein
VNADGDPLRSKDAPADGTRSGEALAAAVPAAVKLTVVDVSDAVLPLYGIKAYSAPLEPPLTHTELPVMPGITCPTVNVSGIAQTVVALFDVFVVSAVAAVGESLQPLAIAPPNRREAHVIRYNMIYTFSVKREMRWNGRTNAYWQVRRP